MLCIECGSEAVTFVGAGSKFIAIDHYQCLSCDCDFITKRAGKSPVAATEHLRPEKRAIVHAVEPPLPSNSTS